MKNLLEYLESNPIHSLTEDFGITVKQYEKEGLYVLNYSQIDSPKTHPIVMECRGIILDTDYNVVCLPFDRFFNLGEALDITGDFNFNTSVAYEKADGSLIKVYYWDGSWRIATRGTAFAETENYTGEKFETLVLKALGFNSLKEFSEALKSVSIPISITFLFEYCSPHNRIVTPYTKDELICLGARYDWGEELKDSKLSMLISYFNSVCDNVRRAEEYKLSDEDSVKKFVNSLPDLKEGVVCKDLSTGLRIKVKADLYVAIHRLRGDSLPTPKRIMNLIVTNETEEYLSYFPENQELFDPYILHFEKMMKEALDDFSVFNEIEDQKEFASKVKDLCYSGVLFSARRSSSSPEKCFYNLDVNKRIKLLDNYIESTN
jgi:hypothetical protein